MASNKHFAVDLVDVKVEEVKAPSLKELLRLADLPNNRNPFGILLRRSKFVQDKGQNWLFDERMAKFHFQNAGYENEITQYKVSLIFDAPIGFNDINADRFLYSLSRQISRDNWSQRNRGVSTFYRLGELNEGSIRANFYAGLLAFGTFVVHYPDLKSGFRELLTDSILLTERIQVALRASKIPYPEERQEEVPDAVLPENRGAMKNKRPLIRN